MVSLVGIIIIAVVANRADPDPTGRRPQSVYFFVVSFVTLTVSITGSAFLVASILLLSAQHTSSTATSLDRLLLVSILIIVVSGVLLVTHLRRGLALARADSSLSSPSRRVGQSYVSVVAFVAMLVLLPTAILSIYLIFSLVSPGTFGGFGGRGSATRILIEAAYLGLVAVIVARVHASLLTPRLGIFGTGGPIGPPPVPAPVPSTIPPPA
jgi:hypothetical protein